MRGTSTRRTRGASGRALAVFAACLAAVALLAAFARIGQPAAQDSADARASSQAAGVQDLASAALSSPEEFLESLGPPGDDDLRLGYRQVNGGVPAFTAQDATTYAYQRFSPLDALGRCGPAMACLGPETLATKERGDISQIHPSGWSQHPYAFVEGGYLYNRSHLVAHSLTGQDANTQNLVTGTRALNADSMEPVERMVLDYIRQTSNHVLYRATPVFVGDEMLCRGIQVEAMSMEDGGQAIQVNVFIYNAQAGVEIDYPTGGNREARRAPSGPDDYDEQAQRAAVEAALSL